MKKIALLIFVMFFAISPAYEVNVQAAEEEKFQFIIYSYNSHEDIPEHIPGYKIVNYVEQSFSNSKFNTLRSEMDERAYDWRRDLPVGVSPIYENNQNMSLVMYYDLQSDLFNLASQINNRIEHYGVDQQGIFLSSESFRFYNNYLAYFQIFIPELIEELEFAREYISFVKGLSNDEIDKLFGVYVATRDYDAENNLVLIEAALYDLEYLSKIEFVYTPYQSVHELSEDELQQLIDRHGFAEDENQSFEHDDGISTVANPDSAMNNEKGSGLKWANMLGWTLIGGVLGWLLKKTFSRLQTVAARKWLEMYKNSTPEEREIMKKDLKTAAKGRTTIVDGAANVNKKITPVTSSLKFVKDRIGKRVPIISTAYTAYETYETITDPTIEEKEKWKKATSTAWKGAWAVVGSAVGTAIAPGYGSVALGFAGYAFGEATSSWAEKAGENLYNLFH